jgi:hypothetical protein
MLHLNQSIIDTCLLESYITRLAFTSTPQENLLTLDKRIQITQVRCRVTLLRR